MNNTPLGLGAHPSVPDYRDVKDYHIAEAVPYPPSFTDDYSMIPVSMQNTLGICTSNLCDKIERLYFQKTGTYTRLSRRFLYTVTKIYIDGNTNEGSSLRSALKAAYKYGVATEASVPTDTTVTHAQFIADSTFTPQIWAEALNYRIGGYISIGVDKDSLAAGISQYGALYARFDVGSTWWLPSWSTCLPLKPSETIVSGHAVTIPIYDSTSPLGMHNTLRNSWSSAWGNQGDGDFYVDQYAPTEAWAVTLNPIVNTLPSEDQFNHVFNTDMELGDTSDEVTQLQTFLKIHGYFDEVAPTGFYGSITQAAVYQFQLDHVSLNWIEKYIYKGKYCGAKTRAAINSM